MTTFYLTFLALGALVLVFQLLGGILGSADDFDLDPGDGLDLFTTRALSTAAAAFGATGLGLMQWGINSWIALPIALAVGFTGAVAIALTMRSLHRLQQDKSFKISMTLGAPAKVSLSIPGGRSGEGKVHLNAHNRFMELNAVTAEDDLPTGTDVFVVDSVSADTVLVSRTNPTT
ncbi:MAG: hypothetical protein KF709_14910 [Gemmatimonadaceae bacterium]|nr:hypothetical protein [Gemmatimonadaceae bacterium]